MGGVSHLTSPQLHGMLRIILEPLLGDVPIVGALTMFFIRRPVSALPPSKGPAAPTSPKKDAAGVQAPPSDPIPPPDLGHQLDRDDQPAGHPGAQVSPSPAVGVFPAPRDHCAVHGPACDCAHTPPPSSMSDTMIMDAISSYLVLPNRLLVPLVPDLHEAAQLRCPLPRVRNLWGGGGSRGSGGHLAPGPPIPG